MEERKCSLHSSGKVLQTALQAKAAAKFAKKTGATSYRYRFLNAAALLFPLANAQPPCYNKYKQSFRA